MFLPFFVQALPVVAQGPQVASASAAQGTIAWEEDASIVSREGYASLIWRPVDGAIDYSVRDQRDVEVYQGPFTQAFVSGLPDGEHAFAVIAFDASGSEIARTSQPKIVAVDHWPLLQSLVLFGIGLVVSVAMTVVIVRGATSVKRQQMNSRSEVME
ncbi:MAG: hypothetical protein R3C05_18130 [Pirellulaceae bacterium]